MTQENNIQFDLTKAIENLEAGKPLHGSSGAMTPHDAAVQLRNDTGVAFAKLKHDSNLASLGHFVMRIYFKGLDK